MAPFLGAGIFHHSDMDRYIDIHQTRTLGRAGIVTHQTDTVKALKAIHELLNKLFSNNSLSNNDDKPLDDDTLKGLAQDAFLVFSKVAYLTPPSSPGQRPQTIHNVEQKDVFMAKTQAIPDDLESRPVINAVKVLTPCSSLDGSRSLSAVPGTSANATKIPTARPDTNGAELAARLPEPERPAQTITPDTAKAAEPPVRGVPEVCSNTAKDRAKPANNATSGIQLHQGDDPRSQTKEDRLRELAQTITKSVETLSSSPTPPNGGPKAAAGSGDTEADKIQLVAAATELLDKVRPGADVIMGWFAQMSVVSAVNVFQHWGVFDLIPAQPGAAISFKELAEKVGADAGLLIRMSWMLTSPSVLRYVPSGSGKGGLSHTPTSLLLRSQSPLSSMFRLLHANIVETSAIMPAYFDTYGRKEPVGPGHIPTSYLTGRPELSYFDLLSQDPQRMKGFMHAMSIQHRRSPVTGMFDLSSVISLAEKMEQSRKLEAEKRPVWVDIGGSDGAVVRTFRQAYPGLKAEWCVVQDLPEVVEAAKEATRDDALLKDVRFCPLDFHHEAPVEGALVYYLRHIVRDYSDPVVINILSSIRKSMIPPSSTVDPETGMAQSTSRILISEQLIPSRPPLYAAFKDYAMLAVGGKERSLENFEAVAEAAGLEVTAVHRDKGTPHAVIEMQVKA